MKNESDEYCYIAIDTDTNLDTLFYMRGNKTITIDLNSVATMYWVTNGRANNAILEPEDADIVKKSIVRYYEKNDLPLPEEFQFLKVYSEKLQPRKPLFG